MKIGNLFFEKNIIAVAAIYFLTSAFIFYIYGIQLGGEAEKYIDNANRIIRGDELRNGSFGFFYIVYSLLVAFFVKFSLPLVLTGIVQVILSFFAAYCFYKLLVNVLAHKKIAFLFFIAYLLCYPVQKWNFYLYSEGIHTSFIVFAVYFFDKYKREKKIYHLVVLVAMVLFILFSRPVGVIFLMAFFAVLLFWLYRSKKRMLFYVVVGLSIVSVTAILNSPLTAFINPDSLRRMEVICQVPEVDNGANYIEFNRQGLSKAFSVIKDEVGIGNFLQIGVKKLGYFFGMYRPYYSWQNNLLLVCYLVFYPLLVIGLFSKQGSPFIYIKLFSVIYLLITSMAIFFTCDDWANRFISPAFPFILILAAGGLLTIFEKFNGGLNITSKHFGSFYSKSKIQNT